MKCDPRSPDMLVIGFQEIVPLTAQQIVQTDPEKRYVVSTFIWHRLSETRSRRIWENKILDTLDRRPNKTCNYVLLRSEQVISY
jgi:synaptojanin